MIRNSKSVLLISIFILLLCSASLAQIRETGTIHGYVMDESGEPLPGATVTLSGPNLIGGERNYITNAKGYFRFPSIPAGPYTVSAELAGFAKMVREVIQLHANKSLTVDFQLTQTSVKEEVVVIAQTPTIDIKSSTTGNVVMDSDILTNIPMSKSIVSAILMAPGVDDQFQSAYGSNVRDNSWMIDGVDITGSYLGGNAFRPDFNIIKEAAFQGLGLPAEFGDYTGAVVNVITKSGSNEFSGLGEIRFHGKGWNSQNNHKFDLSEWLDPSFAADYTSGDAYDAGLQFGGKILHDKLWFFASAEYIYSRYYQLGVPGSAPSYIPKLFLKTDFQVNNSNRLNVSFIWQKSIDDNYMMGYDLPEDIAGISRAPRFSLTANWTSIFSPQTLLEVRVSHFHQRQDILSKAGLEDIPGGYDYYTGIYVDNYPYYQHENDMKYQAVAQLTHFIPDFFGSHDMKFGAEVNASSYSIEDGYPGNITYYYFMGSPEEKYERDPLIKDYKFRTITIFAQDSWTLGRRLTINAGLRYSNYQFNIPTETLGTVYSTGSLAPRIGFAFDILGDRKNVIKFHYGHYYQALKANAFASMDPRGVEETVSIWTGADWMELYKILPAESGWSVDPDLKQPFMHEFVAGFERELFKDASLEINAYYRKGMRFMGPVRTNGEYDLINALNPGPDGIPYTSDDSNFPYYNLVNRYDSPEYILTNPEAGMSNTMLDDPKKTQKGFEIIFNKRMSHNWQLQLSYAYGISRGNTSYLDTTLGEDPNYFTNAYGPMYFSGEPHHFKAMGSIILPLDINLSAQFSLISARKEAAWAYLRTPYGIARQQVTSVKEGMEYGLNKGMSVRLEKRFQLGGKKMLTVMANVDNPFNWACDLFRYRFYGSMFKKLMVIQEPRSITISARFWF